MTSPGHSEPPQLFRELRERYDRGERNFAEAFLCEDPDHDQRGICLDGADLSRAFIDADFSGGSLRGVKFRGANVKTCCFDHADLRGADFRDALICAATFDGALLDGADFIGASIHSYHFKAGETPHNIW